jgi:F0F1-type ATP synthase membrane subunit a
MKAAFQRWLWLVTVLPGGTVFGAEPGHGLSQNAVKIEHWGGFITNSMVVSWVVAIILIIFARVATRNMKGIPGGAQNLLEWLVESLYDFLEKIIGPHLVKRTFWFLATIFIFILSASVRIHEDFFNTHPCSRQLSGSRGKIQTE